MDEETPERAAPPAAPLAVASGPEDSLLSQVRNMEEFAALGQFLFLFGTQALKLPDFSIEVGICHFILFFFRFWLMSGREGLGGGGFRSPVGLGYADSAVAG